MEAVEAVRLPEWSGLTVNATWHIEPGLPQQPATLYLGADPGLLFRSDDAGETWEPNRGILEYPTRDRWVPGRGGVLCDSIQLDPGEPQRMYVCVTSAGTLRTDDGGQTWLLVNKNVATEYLPVLYPETGQCVHKLLLHPARPERLWQQNHCGVYRSDNCGNSWERLDENGLPSGFGFPIMIDPEDPDKAFVIPEKSRSITTPRAGGWPSTAPRRRADLGADVRRLAEAVLGDCTSGGLGLRRGLAVFRHPERLLLRTGRG